MALNHVPGGAGGFVEGRALLHSEDFRGGDLHVIDVIPVPQRLKNAVPEAQHQKVLHRVFSKVMVDAINLRFIKRFKDDII